MFRGQVARIYEGFLEWDSYKNGAKTASKQRTNPSFRRAQFVQPAIVESLPPPSKFVQSSSAVISEESSPMKEVKEEPVEEEEMPLLRPVLPLPDVHLFIIFLYWNVQKNGEIRQKTSPKRKKRSPTPTLRLPKNISEEDFMLPAEIFVDCGRAVPVEVLEYWLRKEEAVRTTRKSSRKRKITYVVLFLFQKRVERA